MASGDRQLVLALAGNPNTGKSTLFNALTGLSQHVGNWPGKTVERAEGSLTIGGRRARVVDLPGIYSLLGGTPEELIARDFICSGTADVLVILIDATNLERNLYLALQALALSQRAVVALNMMDEVKGRGWQIDVAALERDLGVPVVPISARNNHGLDRLLSTVTAVAARPKSDRKAGTTPVPICPERAARDLYRRAESISRAALVRVDEGPTLTDRLDAVVTHRWWAFPVMMVLVAAVFGITMFGAEPISEVLADLFGKLAVGASAALAAAGAPAVVEDALVSGLILGVGAVVSVMLPTMTIFFVLFAVLEDSGVIPRIAFNMDRPMQAVGTQGKHCLSCLMGYGCNIPGVMSTRIMDGSHRLIAILTNSLIPCNGKLGVILPLSAAFFGRLAPAVVIGLLGISVLMVMAVSWILSRTLFRGEAPGFVLEMPPYRLPQFGRVIVRALRDRVGHVLIRASAIAAPMTVAIWALSRYPSGGGWDATYAGQLVRALDPVGKLLGLDGQILVAIAFAFPAKEIVIGALAVTAGLSRALDGAGVIHDFLVYHWSPFTALNFLLFYTFFLPCVYTAVTIQRETRRLSLTAWGLAIPAVVAVSLSLLLSLIGRVAGWR